MSRFSQEILDQVGLINIVDYALNNQYELYQIGNHFKIKEFGGLCINSEGNKWNCFSDDSKNAGGGIIQFVMYMKGLEFREAIKELMNYSNIHPKSEQIIKHFKISKQKSKTFNLPKKANRYNHLYAYLLKTRKINKSIVDYYVKQHKIYEDERHNIVFCGGDRKGKIHSASLRGTYDQEGKKSFKGLVENSNKNYPFAFTGKNDRVLIFEAPIDLLSYQTIEKEYNQKIGYKDHYIALNGVTHEAVIHYLKEYPEIKRLLFCLDNDEAGIQNTINLIKVIEKEKLDMKIDVKQPILKDWNDDLKMYENEKKLELNNYDEMEM